MIVLMASRSHCKKIVYNHAQSFLHLRFGHKIENYSMTLLLKIL